MGESLLSCVIKSKQNLLFESKCVSNSFKKYDGYKELKILEVISILTFKKTIVVDSEKISDKTVKCYYPALINIYTFQTC